MPQTAPPEFPPPASEGWIGPIKQLDYDDRPTPPDGTLVCTAGIVEGDEVTALEMWLLLPPSATQTERDFWARQV